MQWKFWELSEAGDPSSPATRMFTTKRYPVYYLSIAKCGCTFVKNLFYALDHGVQHPSGNAVHAHEGDLRRALPKDEAAIRQSNYAFVVLRDPVDRFMSFYFDKIFANTRQNFPALRLRLAESHGLDLSPDLDIAGHRSNAHSLAQWVSDALHSRQKNAGHHHWKRQNTRVKRAAALGLVRLTLDGLDKQLPALLSPVIPDIAARMATVTARNETTRPVPQDAVLDAKLISAVDRIYAKDRAIYDAAARDWADRLSPDTPTPIEGQR